MVCLGGYGTHWVPSVQLDELCMMLWDMAAVPQLRHPQPLQPRCRALGGQPDVDPASRPTPGRSATCGPPRARRGRLRRRTATGKPAGASGDRPAELARATAGAAPRESRGRPRLAPPSTEFAGSSSSTAANRGESPAPRPDAAPRPGVCEPGLRAAAGPRPHGDRCEPRPTATADPRTLGSLLARPDEPSRHERRRGHPGGLPEDRPVRPRRPASAWRGDRLHRVSVTGRSRRGLQTMDQPPFSNRDEPRVDGLEPDAPTPATPADRSATIVALRHRRRRPLQPAPPDLLVAAGAAGRGTGAGRRRRGAGQRGAQEPGPGRAWGRST